MKRNIFIRVVCLLLCVSMLTPIVASATGGTPTPEKETTNEMAYVDLFFLDDGSDSPLGDDLKKWLDMTPKVVANGNWEDSAERVGSGYLMLEFEMDNQKDKSGIFDYDFREKFIRTNREMFEMIGSFGLNYVGENDVQEKFLEKFPVTGKEAYIYYNYLTQFYMDYVDALQVTTENANQAWQDIAEVVTGVEDLSMNGINAVYAESRKTHSVVIVGDSVGSNATKLDVVNMRKLDDGGIELIVKTDIGEEPILLLECLENNIRHRAVSLDLSDIRINSDEAYSMLNEGLSAIKEAAGNNAPGMKKLDLDRLSWGQFKNILDGLKETKEYKNLPPKVRKAFGEVEEWLKKKNTPKINLPKAVKIGGHILNVVGYIDGIKTYGEERDDLTARQITYLNAITNDTVGYLDMLLQMDKTLEKSGIGDKYVYAISDAIGAIWQDSLLLDVKLREEIGKEDGERFAYETLSDVIVNIVLDYGPTLAKLYIQSISLIMQEAGITMKEGIKKAASKVVAIAGKAMDISTCFAIGSVFLNMGTDQFVEFDDNVRAIYNLKKALWQSLVDEKNGLLIQYRNNRSHERALAIICALNTIKDAKIKGEYLVEEYYLFDLYKSANIDPSGNVHELLRNEIITESLTSDLRAEDNIMSVRNPEAPYLYSKGDITIPLSIKEYKDYMILQNKINRMTKFYGSNSEGIEWHEWLSQISEGVLGNDEQNKQTQRLMWTHITRQWIEDFKMYNKSVDYINRSKYMHSTWAQNNP